MDHHAGNAGIIYDGRARGVLSAALFIVNHGWYIIFADRVVWITCNIYSTSSRPACRCHP